MENLYPAFIRLKSRRVLVVGGGPVGLRKARGLLECGAIVTLVAPELRAERPAGQLDWRERRFRLSDLAGKFLVYAATNDRKVNARIAQECQRRGIPVNVADAPEECDFFVPARIRRPEFVLAISTEGKKPRAAAELRRRLEELL